MNTLRDSVEVIRPLVRSVAQLEQRGAELRGAAERSHAQLDEIVVAIDQRIDECVCIGEELCAPAQSARAMDAVREVERLIRRLGVLRAEILSQYVVTGRPGQG